MRNDHVVHVYTKFHVT